VPEAGPGPRPQVLAAIVNFDQAALTVRAVETLLNQRGAEHVHLIVFDNGSSPAEVALLEAALDARVELVRWSRNLGYGAACNAAARDATRRGTPYVWWLNNDLELEPDVLEHLVARLEAAPRTAAVGAVTVDHATGSQVLGAGMNLSMWRSEVTNRHAGQSVDRLPAEPYAVDVIAATCMMVRIEAVREIGGLDEGYFMYGEDVDWSIRARAAGHVLEIVPAARARHGWGRSSRPEGRLQFIMRNRIRLIRARASAPVQVAFIAYYVVAWLPAYTAVRLIPRFGLRLGLRIAIVPLLWNMRDAIRRGHWRLRAQDLEIRRI
jgi:GT2 family glycosyltransferase